MSSEDNEDHAFDTSSLRHLKVFERLHALVSFQAWKSKRHRNADVLSCFMADERTSADNQVDAFDTSSLRHLKVFERLHA
jgi:hypothetical protein